jgi:hypothetical protein
MSLAYKGNRGQGPSRLLHQEVHILIVPDLFHTAALQEGVAVGLRTTGVHILAGASLLQRLQVLPRQVAAPSPLPLLPARSMTGLRPMYTYRWPTGLAEVLSSTSLIQLWLLAFMHTVACTAIANACRRCCLALVGRACRLHELCNVNISPYHVHQVIKLVHKILRIDLWEVSC